MSEYVNKFAVIRALLKDFKDERHTWYSASYAIDIMAKIVDEMPSADVRPVVHGRWKQISPARIYECSKCGQEVMTCDIDVYKYCHGCGAKMEDDYATD